MLGFAKDLALPASSPPSPNSLPSFWEVSVTLPFNPPWLPLPALWGGLSSLTLGWQVGEGKWLSAAELPALLPTAAATTEPGQVTAQQRKTEADPSSGEGRGGAGRHGGVSFSTPVDERRLGLNLINHFAASAKTQKGGGRPVPPATLLQGCLALPSLSPHGLLGGLHRARSRTKEGC